MDAATQTMIRNIEAYVSFRRKKQFALAQPTTTRIDVVDDELRDWLRQAYGGAA